MPCCALSFPANFPSGIQAKNDRGWLGGAAHAQCGFFESNRTVSASCTSASRAGGHCDPPSQAMSRDSYSTRDAIARGQTSRRSTEGSARRGSAQRTFNSGLLATCVASTSCRRSLPPGIKLQVWLARSALRSALSHQRSLHGNFAGCCGLLSTWCCGGLATLTQDATLDDSSPNRELRRPSCVRRSCGVRQGPACCPCCVHRRVGRGAAGIAAP